MKSRLLALAARLVPLAHPSAADEPNPVGFPKAGFTLPARPKK